ncbi:nicotinate phosphoribosyltransferase, (NAPRTase) family [Ancylostoma ceylanicum]|uniref:Nicotinamide phosphoribosyltransferase n=1 Tax=Ancylostoma ceylanicum TaxID=53326 RepID=A0A0D6LS67_9BILA|nr:nicotinate phosphoribosyltransferase, (NAPRTase) family [Ancylostoma ceylanicum]
MSEPSFVENVLYLADSYKITHHNQYPQGTTYVYSYFESRGGKFPEVCFFGLQYILKRWLVGVVVTHKMIDEAKEFYKLHFNMEVFNEAGWRHIVEKHGGHLPLRIKAVPEGSVVPTKNVLFTIENTDPAVPWLTNWFETLLVQTWYPITVCTSSRAYKQLIGRYLEETSDSLDGLPFKLHDFGYRGSTSVESAGIGGAAHLVNFVGTDTIAGLQLCRKYYSCKMAGYSIPAAEHSTITTWKKAGEVAAFRNMLQQYPKGLVSVVSDSYDVFHAVSSIWGEELRDEVIARGERGCLVIRPDSGDPITVLVKVLKLLEEKFPVTKNSKGYKILPAYLRVIQGDGINYDSTGMILEALKKAGWSTDNVVFGAGGALLQRIDRDTQKCAFKCSHVIVNGEHRDVYKNPATDEGKRSKKGYLTLVRNASGNFETVQEGQGDPAKDLLQTVFENGHLLVDWTLEEIRKRAEIDLVKNSRKTCLNGLNKRHPDSVVGM